MIEPITLFDIYKTERHRLMPCGAMIVMHFNADEDEDCGSLGIDGSGDYELLEKTNDPQLYNKLMAQLPSIVSAYYNFVRNHINEKWLCDAIIQGWVKKDDAFRLCRLADLNENKLHTYLVFS